MPVIGKPAITEQLPFTRKINGRSPPKTYKRILSSNSKPEWPTTLYPLPVQYWNYGLNNDCDWFDPTWPTWDPRESCHSVIPSYDWDNRLYAGVYAKAMSGVRGPSAQWGMNILQYDKALRTFVDLSALSATAISAIHGKYKAVLPYMNHERDEITPKRVKVKLTRAQRALRRLNAQRWADRKAQHRKRIRIKNEVFILRQISDVFIAWRYAISPIMSDLAATAEILSAPPAEEFTSYRKSGVRRVVRRPDKSSWRRIGFTGTERCTVQFTARVENRNLALANQLGFTNPLYWAWDNTPWSFMVDWFLPIGTFIESFTAELGFEFQNASVTRTMKGDVSLDCDYTAAQSRRFTGTGWYTYKERVLSHSLPMPMAIPYGNGLNLPRAQNALALALGKLTRGKVPFPNLWKT